MVRQRLCVFLLALVLVFSLAACKAESPDPTEDPNDPEHLTVYTATGFWSGDSYTVDKENCTITDGKYTYKYKLEGTDPNYRITVLYPNGYDGVWVCRENGGGGGGFTGGLGTDYADIADLADAVVQGAPKAPVTTPNPAPPKKPGFFKRYGYSILLIVLGALFVAFPEPMARGKFYLWVKNAEPSDFAIAFYMFLGIFCILVGVLTL